MLDQARAKAWRVPVDLAQADGETLVADDLGAPVDGVLAAYLFRNITARDRLLEQVLASLAPGGALAVHEYAVRGDRRARLVWDAVCWGVVVPLGLVTAPRSGIYRYLWRSVIDFDSVVGFRDRMSRAGFAGVRSRTFRGLQPWVLHTFVGTRP
jgi:ubiquinone/menaquinone biosynthesis C-methylase UbiE